MSENLFFKNKNVLITGGTGSIGSEVLKRLTSLPVKKITIFSRDEYKQYQLRYLYRNSPVTIEYILGDVRDSEALSFASRDTDILFHCSAFKHVPQSEEMPEEFIKTNVLGSVNVKKAALTNKISTVVSISSDKAVNPSNTMGLTKALQEKIFSSYSLQKNSIENQRFVNVRFGNVIGTKGSLFPILYHQIKNNEPITVTDPSMTRFFMTKSDAIDLIFWSGINGENGQTIIKKMKAVAIGTLIKIYLLVLSQSENYPIEKIGLRVGEKKHESLITEDELYKVKSKKNFYLINPYTEVELEKNILLSSTKELRKSMDEFNSECKDNHFSDKEIDLLIRDYILSVKDQHQFI